MAGNPQVPPDGFFPTRRNPQSLQRDAESFEIPRPPQNPAFQDSRPMNPPQANCRSVFFKTRPCKQFERGECQQGKFCNFAHGPGDLRQPPPNWQELVARERLGEQKHRACNNFYKGEGCVYAEVWKTKPCYRYEKFGRCVNGDNCQYAHGSAELRKFGGDANSGKANFEVAPSKALQELARDAPSIKTEPIFAQENHEDKKLLEWKGPKKISLIYGDWIHDHSS